MSKTRVLLAEDDADHERLLTAALRNGRPGLEVSVVRGRDGVLEALRNERFDGVVLDFNLPPFDAPTILKDAQLLLGDTPVIVVSSQAAQGVVIESLRVGVADFVPKELAVQGSNLWKRLEAAIRIARQARTERRSSQRRLDTLRQAANIDPLTGLSNRRHAALILDSERQRKDRREFSSCVLLDLDHFKAINDVHGHHAGDTVLARVADLLRRHAAPSDAVVRWGGEEFLVIKGSATLAAAWSWAERVRQELRELEFEFEGQSVRVTASFGIVCVPSRGLCEDSVQVADRALYLAKDLGRDRVCTAPMVRVYEAAQSFEAQPGLSESDLAAALFEAVRPIGLTQQEHVGPHSRLVRELAVRIGRAIPLGGEDLDDLRRAACLHDIGKLAIPEELLAKPEALTADERSLVDSHARFGADLCTVLGLRETVVDAVEHHHDRFDWPKSSTDIRPVRALLSRIICVADAFVAMTSDRPYAARRNPQEALAEILQERGRQFAPDVVDTVHVVDAPSVVSAMPTISIPARGARGPCTLKGELR